MNPEIKAKWLEALRSGRYKQGTHWLKGRGDKFCCLGVFCDLVNPEGWGETWHQGTLHKNLPSVPESDLTESAGVSDEDVTTLYSMNDEGKSFSEIADWIEANL